MPTDLRRRLRRTPGRAPAALLAAALLAASLCACTDATPSLTGFADGEPTTGGRIALSSCGYAVTSREGATAPRPREDRLGPDPRPFAVHLGLSGAATRTINVVWRTRDEETLSSQVEFGEGEALDQVVTGFSFAYEVPGRAPVRIHEAHLCGLRPGTRYSYRVGGREGDRAVFSPTYSFRTAPDLRRNPGAKVLIAVLGDTRGGLAYFGQTLQRAQAMGPPDLALFSGDATLLGFLQPEWDEYFAAAEPVLATVPMLAAHGNHEANSVNYYSQFALPGDEENYGLDYGAARVTVLNDSPADPADLPGRVAPFLAADLRQPAPFHLVLHHRSLWSASFHGNDAALQALLGPILDEARADLVLSGHDHNYERTHPLRGGAPQASPRDGTTFVVSGSAGAGLYDSGAGPWTALSESTRSFLLIEVGQRSLDLRAFRDDGTPLDALRLTRP